MDESKRGFEAPGESRPSEDEEGGEGIEDDDEDDEEELEEGVDDEEDEDDGGSEGGGEQSTGLRKGKLGGARSETLAAAPSSLQLSKSDIPRDFALSSHLLSEVPVDYALLRPLETAEFKDQVEISHQQALVNVTAQAAEVQSQNLSSGHPTSSSELSPISSTPNPKLRDQKSSSVAKANSACVPDPESEQQKSSNSKTPPSLPVMKMPSTDGFNWRKYGQKQVKSPQGSRSYYKCTYSECHAKKIECSDLSNRVIEIISKGEHNHDPPRRINCTKENQLALCSAPATTAQPETRLTDLDSSASSKELVREKSAVPETKGQNSSASAVTAEVDIKEEHIDEPEPKRRMKKANSAYSASPSKPGKKPKIVVHAAGDVGISGDGYRWRKYGQKMVKGNPHPRNYYRCTSAGCPVRKHIERAVDNSSAVIITYKGVHDHNMPVPKKRHGPPNAPLVAAAAPASMNNLQLKKPEVIPNQTSATQWSVDKEGELTAEALDAGEEKAIESARTLLSIGFEIKQC